MRDTFKTSRGPTFFADQLMNRFFATISRVGGGSSSTKKQVMQHSNLDQAILHLKESSAATEDSNTSCMSEIDLNGPEIDETDVMFSNLEEEWDLFVVESKMEKVCATSSSSSVPFELFLPYLERNCHISFDKSQGYSILKLAKSV